MNPEKKKQGIDNESLLRLAAAAIHEQEIEEENAGIGSISLSEQDIRRQWNSIMKKYRKRMLQEKAGYLLRKTAAAAAALVLAMGGTMVTAMAVSPAIREIILTDFGEYSDLKMLFSGNRMEIPKGWEEKYYPAYIPEGFIYKEIKSTSKVKGIIYVNDEKQYLGFTIITPDANVSIDTENMTVSEITVNGRNAILFEKKDSLKSSILINYENCVIDIYGPISSEEIIKIAENITSQR